MSTFKNAGTLPDTANCIDIRTPLEIAFSMKMMRECYFELKLEGAESEWRIIEASNALVAEYNERLAKS